MFKVSIFGGSCVDDYNLFKEKCDFFLHNKKTNDIMINTVGDKFCAKYAKENRIDTNTFNSNWKMYGRNANIERNKAMLSQSDGVIVFDNGTKDTDIFIDMAKKSNVPLRRIAVDSEVTIL